MPDPAPWRRLSDWKREVTLVRVADVGPAVLRQEGWVLPADSLRDKFPRVAALVAEHPLARVEPAVAKALRARGVVTTVVGYHRGVDGLLYAEDGPGGHERREVAVAALDLGDDDGDWIDDAVDGVLRCLSEGLVTERAVLVAALAPPLGPPAPPEEAELASFEAGGWEPLPEASPTTVDAVAAALAAQGPPRRYLPALPPAARRAHQRNAAIVGGLALAVSVVSARWTPWVAVLAAPVVVLCAVVIAIHALALRSAEG